MIELAVGAAGACFAATTYALGLFIGRRDEQIRGDEDLVDLAVAMQGDAIQGREQSDGGITALQQSYGLEHGADMVSRALDRRRLRRVGLGKAHERSAPRATP